MKRRPKKRESKKSALAAGHDYEPCAGDAVVFDANVLIDYLLLDLMKYPTRNATAAKRLMDKCCIAHHSEKLIDEAMKARQSRLGGWVPPAIVERYQNDRYKRGKLLPVNEKHLAETRLPLDVERIVIEKTREPGKDKPRDGDLHVVRLAKAVSARAVITEDKNLKESGMSPQVARIVLIVDAEWVIQKVSEPAPVEACP